MSTPYLVSGLDLGKQQDFTALVILEVSQCPDLDQPGHTLPHFAVVHLHRWHLGTKYQEITTDLKAMYARLYQLMNTPLVVDSTGVGNSVVEVLETAGLSASICPYIITSGAEPGNGTVPKKDIVASILVPLQTGRLKIARQLEHADTLKHELETFRVRVTESRNETFSADKESDHDDFVTALGLAMWYGAKLLGHPGCYSIEPVPNSPPPIKRKVWDGGESRRWGFR